MYAFMIQEAEKIKVELFPPKPKELEMIFFTETFSKNVVTGVKFNSFMGVIKRRLG